MFFKCFKLLSYSGNPRQNRHTAFVGCSLWKRSTQIYSTADTIVYDGIALNSGNHFDSILNQFICPFNGIYYVTATAKKHSTSDLQVDVVHATATLFRLEDLRMSGNTVSNSALVRCFTGEVIQVKAAGSGRIFGEYNGKFTTLNIFMMFKIWILIKNIYHCNHTGESIGLNKQLLGVKKSISRA